MAQAAVALLGISNGKLTITPLLAKWCKPTFDTEDPTVVKSVEIRYPYLEDYTDPATQKKSKRCMLFRREINDTADVKYEPVEAPKDATTEPKWTQAGTVEHQLGFCPVIWYPFLKQETGVQDIDGRAIHEHLLDEIALARGEHAVRGQALRDLYASVDIATGDSCFAGSGLANYWSDRIPETLGRGGFLMHPYVPGIEAHFEPGTHFASWNAGDWDQLGEDIDYFLDHPDRREEIRHAGWEHTLAHHTYDVRMNQLVDLLLERGML